MIYFSVADLGSVAWRGEKNFKRALEWFFIVRRGEFQKVAYRIFDCGAGRISRGHLHGF